MADKVQLIKQEIERLKHNTPNAYDLSRFMLLEEIENFIDTIPEESGCEVNCTTKSDNCDDLEEAAELYYEEDCPYEGEARVVNNEHDVWFPSQAIEDAFIAGAKWQEEKMNLRLQTEYEKGLFDMREEMMKNAVDAWVNTYESVTNPYDNQVSFITELSPSKFRNEETVQIIIVKTEHQ